MTLSYYEVLYVGMAKIWLNLGDAENGFSQWVNTQLSGALCIVKDLTNVKKAPYIIMYDMNNFNRVFKLEIYQNFHNNIFSLNPHIFYTKIPFTCYYIAFSFPNENQSFNCQRVIKQVSPKSSKDILLHPQTQPLQPAQQQQQKEFQQQSQQKQNNMELPKLEVIQAESYIVEQDFTPSSKKPTQSTVQDPIAEEQEENMNSNQIQDKNRLSVQPYQIQEPIMSEGELEEQQEVQRIKDMKLTKEEKHIIRNAGISKKELKTNDNIKRMVSEIFISKKRQKRIEKKEQEELEQIKLRKTLNPSHSFIMGGNQNSQNPGNGFMSVLKNLINKNDQKENQSSPNPHMSFIQAQRASKINQVQTPEKNPDSLNKIKGAFLTSLLKTNNLQDIARASIYNQRQSYLASSKMPLEKASSQIPTPNTLQVPQAPPLLNIMASPSSNPSSNIPAGPSLASIMNAKSPRASMNMNIPTPRSPSKSIKPSFNPNVSPNQGDPKSGLLDQIRNNNLKLRHVETNKQKKEQVYSKEEQVGLTAHLANEIKNRRNVIKKNYMDSEDSDEASEWDEDSDYDL